MNDLLVNHKFQVLHFLLRDAHFCMEIKYVEKILPLVLIQAVPNSPPHMVGLINHAGKSITVIDLATLLGFDLGKKYSRNTPILLCSDGNHTAGMIIDHVIGLGDVEEKSIQMQKEFETKRSLFLAAITLKTEVALLINTKQILEDNLSPVKQNDLKEQRESPL